jgi:hypothetical protein
MLGGVKGHNLGVVAFLQVTRCFGFPSALVARHSDIPSLAQLQANREGTLFGPCLILFREGLRIGRGN